MCTLTYFKHDATPGFKNDFQHRQMCQFNFICFSIFKMSKKHNSFSFVQLLYFYYHFEVVTVYFHVMQMYTSTESSEENILFLNCFIIITITIMMITIIDSFQIFLKNISNIFKQNFKILYLHYIALDLIGWNQCLVFILESDSSD